MINVQKYSGWEDIVVSLIPHEDYVKLAQFKGVEFWGNNRFMAIFIPEQTEKPLRWEAHWWTKASAIYAFRSAKKSLAEFFRIHYNSKLIGMTECGNREAIKMARLLGFKPTGFTALNNIPYILSIKEGE